MSLGNESEQPAQPPQWTPPAAPQSPPTQPPFPPPFPTQQNQMPSWDATPRHDYPSAPPMAPQQGAGGYWAPPPSGPRPPMPPIPPSGGYPFGYGPTPAPVPPQPAAHSSRRTFGRAAVATLVVLTAIVAILGGMVIGSGLSGKLSPTSSQANNPAVGNNGVPTAPANPGSGSSNTPFFGNGGGFGNGSSSSGSANQGTQNNGSSSSLSTAAARVQPGVVNIVTQLGYEQAMAAGTGMVIGSSGQVLTNNHVVQGATTIKVTLTGGKSLPGKVVGTDPFADLAVVKVDSPEPLPAAALGSSGGLQVGELAIAIGNPFGLGSTVTTGVVSALNRNIQLPNLIVENLIQTSAQINPGNSGGALVDSSGRVIGINTAILPNAQGIGFAIPSDVARAEMEQLIAHGQVVRPWVGVDYGGEIDPQTARAYNLTTDYGVLVRGVEPSSPAAKAGLQPNDIITEVSGQKVTSWNDFVRDIVGKKIGDTVTITYVRGGATHKVSVTLTERPAEPH